MPVLTPAYGKDYTSAKAARTAYLAGHDFILNDVTSRWDGKPCSVRDLAGQPVTIRYARRTRVVVVKGGV